MYHRIYTYAAGRPEGAPEGQPEGFAILHCDHNCPATVAVPFTAADRYPMALATEAAVEAGWQLLGADDRCPAHRRPGGPAADQHVLAVELRTGDVMRDPNGDLRVTAIGGEASGAVAAHVLALDGKFEAVYRFDPADVCRIAARPAVTS